MTQISRKSSPELDEVETVLTLLEAHIPLSLLLDLATPLHSDEVYLTEPGVADWLTALSA